jgi:gluconokinase
VTGASGKTRHAIVMGVSGCGKTTLGENLSEALGWRFVEGDSYHPKANVEKMSAGIPLEDEDRWPWLEALAEEIRNDAEAGRCSIVGCSALKKAYRDILRTGAADVFFLHMHGDRETFVDRLGHRQGHFFPAKLLESQLAALEPLGPGEAGTVINIALDEEEQLAAALRALTPRD